MKGQPRVRGYCPMGCGETLVLRNGHVRCEHPDCPRRTAVAVIIADSETEHIVEIKDYSFTVQHPLRERVDCADARKSVKVAMFTCDILERLHALSEPPVEPGFYRVTVHEPDAYSESYRGDATGLDFEKLP